MMNEGKGIAEELARIEKDLIDIKTSQPTGSSSVRAYDTLTNSVWDYDHTMEARNYDGISYFHGFTVVFTSRSQSAPFASLRLIAQVNGVRYNPLSATSTNGGATTGVDFSYIQIYEDITSSGSLQDYALDNTVRWRVQVRSRSLGTNVKIKPIITATDQGRMEIIEFGAL